MKRFSKQKAEAATRRISIPAERAAKCGICRKWIDIAAAVHDVECGCCCREHYDFPHNIEKKYYSRPRLTAEALKERGIEWPEWAVCAYVFPLGFAHFCSVNATPCDYERGNDISRNMDGSYWRAEIGFRIMQIPGKWDASDWEHSKIQRPEQWVPFTRETLPKLPFVVRRKTINDSVLVITAATKSLVWIGPDPNGESYSDLFEKYSMEDGSPCGVNK